MSFEPVPPQLEHFPVGRDAVLSTFDPLRPHRPPRRVRRARAALVGLLVGAFGMVTWFTYQRVDEQIRQGMGENLSAILDATVGATRAFFEGREEMVKGLAASPPIAVDATLALHGREDDRARASQDLEARLGPLRTARMITGYAILSPERIVVLRSGSEIRVEDIDGVLWERLATRGSGVSRPLVRALDTDGMEEARFLAASTLGPLQQPIGYLVVELDSSSAAQRLQLSQWGDSGEVFAFDSEGRLLTEGRYTDELKKTGLLPATRESSVRFRLVDGAARKGALANAPPEELPLTLMAREATAGRSGKNVIGYYNSLGTKVVGAWTWLPEYDFGVAAEMARADALAPVALLGRSSLALAVLTLLALAGFLYLGRWTFKLREQSVLVSQRLDRLARALQPLSAALESDPGAVLLVNDRLEVVYANPAAVRLLGTSQPLAGAPIASVLATLSPELREALIEGEDTVVSQGDADGETVLVSTRELTIDGKQHELYMMRPCTQELRRQEVEHWKKLIRVLSHELNNSLAPISSLVTSARKLTHGASNTEKLDKIFDTIADRTNHLSAFLESYRSVARLPRPARRDVEWKRFIESLRTQYEFQLEGDIPGGTGYFDPAQLDRVLVNLIKNARESGGPPDAVAVRVVEDADGIRIDVLDRGTGMSPRVLEQAMLPFYSTKRTGTGVGLALSREIVEAHHGRITLKNRDGGGLCVSVWIPDRAEHLLSTTDLGVAGYGGESLR